MSRNTRQILITERITVETRKEAVLVMSNAGEKMSLERAAEVKLHQRELGGWCLSMVMSLLEMYFRKIIVTNTSAFKHRHSQIGQFSSRNFF